MANLPLRFPRESRREDHRHGPEAWLLDRLKQVRLRTWVMLGGVLLVLLALALWLLVLAWQAMEERAPALQAFAGEILRATSQAEVAEVLGADGLPAVAEQAQRALDPYAAELDRYVPGASGELQATARSLLGLPAASPDEPASQTGSGSGEQAR